MEGRGKGCNGGRRWMFKEHLRRPFYYALITLLITLWGSVSWEGRVPCLQTRHMFSPDPSHLKKGEEKENPNSAVHTFRDRRLMSPLHVFIRTLTSSTNNRFSSDTLSAYFSIYFMANQSLSRSKQMDVRHFSGPAYLCMSRLWVPALLWSHPNCSRVSHFLPESTALSHFPQFSFVCLFVLFCCFVHPIWKGASSSGLAIVLTGTLHFKAFGLAVMQRDSSTRRGGGAALGILTLKGCWYIPHKLVWCAGALAVHTVLCTWRHQSEPVRESTPPENQQLVGEQIHRPSSDTNRDESVRISHCSEHLVFS